MTGENCHGKRSRLSSAVTRQTLSVEQAVTPNARLPAGKRPGKPQISTRIRAIHSLQVTNSCHELTRFPALAEYDPVSETETLTTTPALHLVAVES
jgi:hypothetical protein